MNTPSFISGNHALENIFKDERQSILMFWLLGITVGLIYLVLPAYIFLTMLACIFIFLCCIIRLEYVFHLFVFTFAVDYVYIFTTIQKTRMVFCPSYFISLFLGIGYATARSIGVVEKRIPTSIDNLMLCIVIYQLISILWAPDFMLCVFFGIVLVINYFMFYVSGTVIRDEDSLKKVVNAWIFSGLVVATGIIVSQWYKYETTITIIGNIKMYLGFVRTSNRPAGFAFVDAVAAWVNCAILLALTNIIYKKGFLSKVMYSLFTLYLLYGLILTTSRGAFIGLIGAIVFFTLLNPKIRGRFIRYSFTLVFLAVFVVLIAKPGFIDRILIGFGYQGTLYLSENFTSTAGLQTGVSGMDLRIEWWKEGLNKMLHSPMTLIFGLGLGGFPHYVHNLEHSIPLAFFFEMGLVGIILYILIFSIIVANLYPFFKKGGDSYSDHMLLAAASILFAVVLINGLIYFDLLSRFFWFPMGFLMAVLNILKMTEAGKNEV